MIFYALFTHKIKKLKCNYWSIFFTQFYHNLCDVKKNNTTLN